MYRAEDRALLDRFIVPSEEDRAFVKGLLHCDIDTFNFEIVDGVDYALMQEFCRGKFVELGENLVLWGSALTGKTHLAHAIAGSICRDGKTARYIDPARDVPHVYERLSRTRPDLVLCDLLILDNLRPVDGDRAQALAEIVYERAERSKSILVTTVCHPDNWRQLAMFGEYSLSVIDRLNTRAKFINIRRRKHPG